MDAFTFPPACQFKLANGEKCPVPASHHWGPVTMCCTHFDLFMAGLLDLKDAIQQRRHDDMVQEYERRTGRTGKLPGAECDAEKKKPE